MASAVALALLPTTRLRVVGGNARALGLPGATPTEHGTWLITSALIRHETIAERLWIQLGPGRERAALEARSAVPRSMSVSKQVAWGVARRMLGDLFAVTSVAPGSPAASAGLAPGDVVVEIDGRAPRPADIDRLLAVARPVPLRVLRNRQVIDMSLVPGERFPQPAGGGADSRPPVI